jgi:hypothetical protein
MVIKLRAINISKNNNYTHQPIYTIIPEKILSKKSLHDIK